MYQLPASIRIKHFTYTYPTNYSLTGYLKDFIFPRKTLQKAQALIAAIRDEKPRIIHLHTHFRELPIGVEAARQSGAKLVYTQHLSVFSQGGIKFRIMAMALRRYYRKCHSIAVSEEIYQEINTMGFRGRKTLYTKLENKLNLNLYPLHHQPHEGIRVVYVARLSSVKGHLDLVRAWAKLSAYPFEVKLFLIGPDYLNNQVQDLCKTLGIENSVVFTGAVTNIPELLAQADIGVFPSYNEGLPIALLEKMAFGIPTIVSNIEALTSIVQHHVNGLIFEKANTDDLAQTLDQLIRDPELRGKLGQAARQTIEQRFGTYNVAAANEMFYQKVLNLSSPA
jgi:glycosyltransferase involved in cell wall biosynthesis